MAYEACETCSRASKGDCNMDCAVLQQRNALVEFAEDYVAGQYGLTPNALTVRAMDLLKSAKTLDGYI